MSKNIKKYFFILGKENWWLDSPDYIFHSYGAYERFGAIHDH